MTQEKVTRKELEILQIGESKEFFLSSENAVQSAQVTAGQMKGKGMKFKCHATSEMKKDGKIVITRLS